jgi:hypothetical protein
MHPSRAMAPSRARGRSPESRPMDIIYRRVFFARFPNLSFRSATPTPSRLATDRWFLRKAPLATAVRWCLVTPRPDAA